MRFKQFAEMPWGYLIFGISVVLYGLSMPDHGAVGEDELKAFSTTNIEIANPGKYYAVFPRDTEPMTIYSSVPIVIVADNAEREKFQKLLQAEENHDTRTTFFTLEELSAALKGAKQ